MPTRTTAAVNNAGHITTPAASSSLPRLPNELWYEILSRVNARDLWLNARHASQGIKDNVEPFWRLLVLPCIEVWVSYQYEVVPNSEASSSASSERYFGHLGYGNNSSPALRKASCWLSPLDTGDAHLESSVLWLTLEGGSLEVDKEGKLALSLEDESSQGSTDRVSYNATIVHCCVLFHSERLNAAARKLGFGLTSEFDGGLSKTVWHVEPSIFHRIDDQAAAVDDWTQLFNVDFENCFDGDQYMRYLAEDGSGSRKRKLETAQPVALNDRKTPGTDSGGF